jgi:hypothetical protein
MARMRSLAFLVVPVLLASSALALEGGDQAFQKLKSLAGEWEAKTPKGSALHVSYRLVSRESVLVETWAPGSKGETLTVFHLDGPSLLATHYCAQGNQPRLKLRSAEGNAYAFEFFDATNLVRPGDSHMHRLRLDLVDADHLTKTETYLSDGNEDTSVLKFSRVK